MNILSTTDDLFFSDADEFTYDQGLNIAVGFTAYDNEVNWSLDPAFGTLVINSYEWGYRADGSAFTERKPIGTHNCTREELNLEESDENARFYSVHESSKTTLNNYWRKMLCIDKHELMVKGDYNSEQARQLNI